MELLTGALGNWVLMAFITPVAWALCCLIDSCLVGKEVYKTPLDGTVVSGLFCLVPILIVLVSPTAEQLTLQLPSTSQSGSLDAVVSGGFYFAHVYCYFRALFKLNDASGTELFLSLSVVVVPLLAFMLLGEQLANNHYLAILVAAGALVVLCRVSVKLQGRAAIVYLSLSVVAVSLSMIFQAKAFATISYPQSVFYFNCTVLLISVLCLLASYAQRRRVIQIFKSLAGVLVVAEMLEVVGRFSAQRAIELGPSVSLVALVECILPVLVMALSCSVIGFDKKFGVLSQELKATFALQLESCGPKIMAMTLIVVSIVIAQPQL